ncbi:MAG: hypothetical protein QOG58_304, partial [Caballeronia sp.]|nr:hypothetical protein [Caballeronia sp.]
MLTDHLTLSKKIVNSLRDGSRLHCIHSAG